MTDVDATSFDPFGIQSNRDESQATRRPVLLAVEKKNKSISHHSQLYSEEHAHYESTDDHNTKGRGGSGAGRLRSAEKQQQQLLAVTQSASLDDSLDPFHVGSVAEPETEATEPVSTSFDKRLEAARQGKTPKIELDPSTGKPKLKSSPKKASLARSGSRALPPKMSIKLTLYEEVSSMALQEEVVASQISVEGSAYAQVQCSDALKNAPFCIYSTIVGVNAANAAPKVNVRPNGKFTSLEPKAKDVQNGPFAAPSTVSMYSVNVPKSELGFVPVVHYSYSQAVDHMPVLLERKVTIHETSCRIALQVRSKLSNKGDLKDFTLAVAIPEVVDGESVQIVRGQGSFDGLKRLIKFQLAHLKKGESFMVSAQARLWKSIQGGEIRFPVLMRCSSTDDHISSVDFEVQQDDGTPCSISVTKAHSFRLLHRLT